jgi:hypothetical protein
MFSEKPLSNLTDISFFLTFAERHFIKQDDKIL